MWSDNVDELCSFFVKMVPCSRTIVTNRAKSTNSTIHSIESRLDQVELGAKKQNVLWKRLNNRLDVLERKVERLHEERNQNNADDIREQVHQLSGQRAMLQEEVTSMMKKMEQFCDEWEQIVKPKKPESGHDVEFWNNWLERFQQLNPGLPSPDVESNGKTSGVPESTTNLQPTLSNVTHRQSLQVRIRSKGCSKQYLEEWWNMLQGQASLDGLDLQKSSDDVHVRMIVTGPDATTKGESIARSFISNNPFIWIRLDRKSLARDTNALRKRLFEFYCGEVNGEEWKRLISFLKQFVES